MAKEGFKPGRRYPIAFEKAEAVKPYLDGETLDLSRGARCIDLILWRCWTISGRAIDIGVAHNGRILSVKLSADPDPERPPAFR